MQTFFSFGALPFLFSTCSPKPVTAQSDCLWVIISPNVSGAVSARMPSHLPVSRLARFSVPIWLIHHVSHHVLHPRFSISPLHWSLQAPPRMLIIIMLRSCPTCSTVLCLEPECEFPAAPLEERVCLSPRNWCQQHCGTYLPRTMVTTSRHQLQRSSNHNGDHLHLLPMALLEAKTLVSTSRLSC